jgi:hypothetical protein
MDVFEIGLNKNIHQSSFKVTGADEVVKITSPEAVCCRVRPCRTQVLESTNSIMSDLRLECLHLAKFSVPHVR